MCPPETGSHCQAGFLLGFLLLHLIIMFLHVLFRNWVHSLTSLLSCPVCHLFLRRDKDVGVPHSCGKAKLFPVYPGYSALCYSFPHRGWGPLSLTGTWVLFIGKDPLPSLFPSLKSIFEIILILIIIIIFHYFYFCC